MNNKFDELTKNLAQSVTRRAALKKFSIGLAGMALACFGLANRAGAAPKGSGCGCVSDADCTRNSHCSFGACVPNWCDTTGGFSCCCTYKNGRCGTARPPCDPSYQYCLQTCQAPCSGA